MKAEDVWVLAPRDWRALLREGHAIEPDALAGWSYRGTSLGMPRLFDRLAWKTFRKCFHRDAPGGALRGWNVRLDQRAARRGELHGRSEPLRDRNDEPVCFGHFAVVPARGRDVPHGFDRGLLLDYSAGSGALDPTSRLRDPIVALREGSAELLLGWSYLAIAGRAVDTPSFFTLEREAPIDHVP